MCRNIFSIMATIAVLSLIIAELFASVDGLSRHHRHISNDKSAVSEDTVYNYLMEFDYLPKSDTETGALRTVEQLEDAIRRLQRFGNIPVTGKIDEDTRKLIQRPRCGVGDGNRSANFSPNNLQNGHHRIKRYSLQGVQWGRTDITWSLVNWTMAEAPQVRRVLTEALNVWARSSKLSFREMRSDQADIQVVFARGNHGDGYNFDGPGQTLAHAFFPGLGRGGDAHFDADEKWQYTSGDSRSTANFLDVAVHEFGHSLGLSHSSDPNAVMYAWYHGGGATSGADFSLTDDDRNAIQELYGVKTKAWAPFKPHPRPQTTTTTTTTARPKIRVYYPQQPQYPSNDPYDPRRGFNYYPHHRTRVTITTTTTTTYRPRTDSPPRPTKGWPERRHPTKPRKLKPDTCQTSYDAISIIRNEIFIFRGQFLWRIGSRGLYEGYPAETRRMWTQLPENYTKIDAVYESRDRKIVFFIGQYYYVFDTVTLVRGYPQPLTSLGLPSSLTHIDAAFVWGHNNRTYLTSGTLYWRLDDDIGKVELDYPRDMAIWGGLVNIDAAFQYSNRKTYFFKGYGYWEFNDDMMSLAHQRPKISARKWMNCQRQVNEVNEEQTWTARLTSEQNDTMDPNWTGGDTSNEISNHADRSSFPWFSLLLALCWWWPGLGTII